MISDCNDPPQEIWEASMLNRNALVLIQLLGSGLACIIYKQVNDDAVFCGLRGIENLSISTKDTIYESFMGDKLQYELIGMEGIFEHVACSYWKYV